MALHLTLPPPSRQPISSRKGVNLATNAVIYVPGLGGAYKTQWLLIQRLRFFGITPYFFASNWASDEPYQAKLARLLHLIDQVGSNHERVALIGVSAGASITLVAQNQRAGIITSVVTICGKILRPETVIAETRRRNPAFQASLEAATAILAGMPPPVKMRILTIRPLYDNVVAVEDQTIPGVPIHLQKSRGHVYSVFLAISLNVQVLAHFIKAKTIDKTA